MRYKKGSKVEVLSKSEGPSGAWLCAEIIDGNEHGYTVKYNIFSGHKDEAVMVERVSRKSIRPCPPAKISDNWMPGDVVEVFHNFSWKMGVVSNVLGRNYYLIRLVGALQEFEVSKCDLRVRQSWQDDKWIVIGKGSVKNKERPNLEYNQSSGFHIEQANAQMNLNVKDGCVAVHNYANFHESHLVPSRTLKQGSPYYSSQIEAHKETSQEYRLTEKEGRGHVVLATFPSASPEKVDVDCTRVIADENYLHACFRKRTTGLSELDWEREKQNGTVGCSNVISSESDDCVSVGCSSVGSCSLINNNLYVAPSKFTTGYVEDTEDLGSDAESFCQLGYEERDYPLPNKEELAEEIHRLELHAYRRTLEALHASGPLSWEQEILVTDLRISLHISNDEHLMELRNLISIAASIPIT